jgi:rhamnosyltransferase
MNPPRVSIVIRTRNGAERLPAVLHAIWQQRFAGGIEVVAVDASSTDGTTDILRDRVDRLLTIAPDASHHGTTCNLGIEAATGELVVLLAQDAVPQGDQWLTALTAPLYVDPSVAGSFARQIPHDDASNLTRVRHRRTLAASLVPFTSQPIDDAEWDLLSPAERYRRCAFDNACSCVRRDVWRSHPFTESPAEDLEWARDVLRAGHRIVHASDAIVMHSRENSVRDEFRRTRLLHERLREMFTMRTINGLPQLALAILTSAASHGWTELAMPERLPRALALAVAWPLAQYLGERRGAAAQPTPAGLGISG